MCACLGPLASACSRSCRSRADSSVGSTNSALWGPSCRRSNSCRWCARVRLPVRSCRSSRVRSPLHETGDALFPRPRSCNAAACVAFNCYAPTHLLRTYSPATRPRPELAWLGRVGCAFSAAPLDRCLHFSPSIQPAPATGPGVAGPGIYSTSDPVKPCLRSRHSCGTSEPACCTLCCRAGSCLPCCCRGSLVSTGRLAQCRLYV